MPGADRAAAVFQKIKPDALISREEARRPSRDNCKPCIFPPMALKQRVATANPGASLRANRAAAQFFRKFLPEHHDLIPHHRHQGINLPDLIFRD